MEFDRDLDVKGLNCPLPILRTKKALAEMETGQVLRVQATDPGSVKDFAAFAKQTGNELLGAEGRKPRLRVLSEAQIETPFLAFFEDRRAPQGSPPLGVSKNRSIA
jgi:tRNA 2-thiouridine synthesizing protein A